MKKINIIAFILMAFSFGLSAQTVIYSTDFDTYTSGGYVAQQIGSPWSTWSSAPGTAEDAHISSTQAHSGANSFYVINNNDQILNLNDKTTGRYIIEWYMFVETGKLGYFNFLSDFAAANSKWAIQAMIYHDSIFVDANGAQSAKKPFLMNTWNDIKLIVDLDDDFATFYVNGAEIVSYQWSKGALGADNLVKLDAINFFGWDGTGSPVTGTSGYYIDDLTFSSVTAPEAASNLTAVLNGLDIDVAWTAPTTTPDSYSLFRNNLSIYSDAAALNYTDAGPWPNTYTYGVKAYYYGLGYSHNSNTVDVLVPGGVSRNVVLMEEGTGTWCGYCPGAAMGLRDLIETNNKDAVAIAYHDGDNYVCADGTARINYYSITGFPTVIADGTLSVEGGNATQSMYASYLPLYNQRIAAPAFHILTMDVVQTAADAYSATITIEQTYQAYASGWKLHTALTESNIAEVWGNQTELDAVCRGMYPSASGTTLDFSTQTTQTVTLNFSTTGYVKNNCEFIAFIQHNSSKLVTQAMMIDLSGIIGIEELQGEKISIYPNPANGYIVALTSGKGSLEIFDITGKLVSTSAINLPTQSIDVSGLDKGVYIVKLTQDSKTFTERLIIQ